MPRSRIDTFVLPITFLAAPTRFYPLRPRRDPICDRDFKNGGRARNASRAARSRDRSGSAHDDPKLRSPVSLPPARTGVAFDLPFHVVSRTADDNESANDITRLATTAVINTGRERDGFLDVPVSHLHDRLGHVIIRQCFVPRRRQSLSLTYSALSRYSVGGIRQDREAPNDAALYGIVGSD
jgi:hypothetical protein